MNRKKLALFGTPSAVIAGLLLLPLEHGPAEQLGVQRAAAASKVRVSGPQNIIVDSERLALESDTGGLIFDAVPGKVQIGRGGDALTERADTDLIVYDPFFSVTSNSTEPALQFNASISDLNIGSGNAADSGDDGDILIENGQGRVSIHLDGAGTVNAELVLGTTGQDGDLQLRNTANAPTIEMDGQSGNLTNALNGNGAVKAWARINRNGTVDRCFRCNTAATETRRLSTGKYEVDFTPLATNIRSRPRSATMDKSSTDNTPPLGFVALAHRNGDSSSVLVQTTNASGNAANRDFVVLIY